MTVPLPLLLDGHPVSPSNPLPDEVLPAHVAVQRTMSTAVTAGQAVTDTGPASSSSTAPVAGLAAASGTGSVWVVTAGDLVVAAPWPVGTLLYLGVDGFPTPNPLTGVVTLPLGRVVTPNRLHVRIGLPIYHPGA